MGAQNQQLIADMHVQQYNGRRMAMVDNVAKELNFVLSNISGGVCELFV